MENSRRPLPRSEWRPKWTLKHIGNDESIAKVMIFRSQDSGLKLHRQPQAVQGIPRTYYRDEQRNEKTNLLDSVKEQMTRTETGLIQSDYSKAMDYGDFRFTTTHDMPAYWRRVNRPGRME